MSKRSRDKGKAGELEVVKLLAGHGFETRRTPNSGGLAIKGDITSLNGGAAIPGYHLEVKRCETLRIPDWLLQAHAEAGANVPVLAFRRNRRQAGALDPLGSWNGLVPLDELLRLIALEQGIAA